MPVQDDFDQQEEDVLPESKDAGTKEHGALTAVSI